MKINDELYRRLEKRAHLLGVSVEDLAAQYIDRGLRKTARSTIEARRTLRELAKTKTKR